MGKFDIRAGVYISCLVKFDQMADNTKYQILFQKDDTANTNYFFFSVHDKKLSFATKITEGEEEELETGEVLDLTEEQTLRHIAINWDSENGKRIFLDGVLVGSDPTNTYLFGAEADDNFYIGLNTKAAVSCVRVADLIATPEILALDMAGMLTGTSINDISSLVEMTEAVSSFPLDFNKAVVLNNNIFLLGVKTIYSADNGITWLETDLPGQESPRLATTDMKFADGYYIASSEVDPYIYYSTNLTNWTSASNTPAWAIAPTIMALKPGKNNTITVIPPLTEDITTDTTLSLAGIDAHFRTKDFAIENPDLDKLYRQVSVRSKQLGDFNYKMNYIIDFREFSQAGSATVNQLNQKYITFGVDSTFETSAAWGPAPTKINAINLRTFYTQPLVGKFLALDFYNKQANQPFEIFGFDIVARPVGRRS
jgi:hypothetical protein